MQLPVFYKCARCPGYCCTYAQIPVSEYDIARLAKRFKISPALAKERFTKPDDEGGRIMRHRKDHIYQTACRFLDPEQRRCTVYEHRPHACRAYPGTSRCGYYDFLSNERSRQEDPKLVITAWITDDEHIELPPPV
ncbi:MAG: YkgJ family cysteine cluster protein [Gemmatimonadetes bacterium]|nr:YkgJ family cysteine cluster protein [Gemmatimonadota bacterium]